MPRSASGPPRREILPVVVALVLLVALTASSLAVLTISHPVLLVIPVTIVGIAVVWLWMRQRSVRLELDLIKEHLFQIESQK